MGHYDSLTMPIYKKEVILDINALVLGANWLEHI